MPSAAKADMIFDKQTPDKFEALASVIEIINENGYWD